MMDWRDASDKEVLDIYITLTTDEQRVDLSQVKVTTDNGFEKRLSELNDKILLEIARTLPEKYEGENGTIVDPDAGYPLIDMRVAIPPESMPDPPEDAGVPDAPIDRELEALLEEQSAK